MLQRVYTPEGLLLETACEVKTLKIAVKDTQRVFLETHLVIRRKLVGKLIEIVNWFD